MLILNNSNNFFSKYNFHLSPIKQVITKTKGTVNSRLVTNLDITYTTNDGTPYNTTIEDSKDENTISTVMGYIKYYLNLWKSDARISSQDKFHFNSKIQSSTCSF